MTPKKLKFVVHSMEATGVINPMLGFCQALQQLGHECVFAVNESLTDLVNKFGFRLAALKQNPDGKADEFSFSDDPAKDLAVMINGMGLFKNNDSLQKMKDFVETEKDVKFVAGARDLLIKFNPQLEAIIEAEKPDCLILDHLLFPPAFGRKDIPCVTLGSVQALNVYSSPELPPASSGYAVGGDRSGWAEFRKVHQAANELYEQFQNELNAHFGFKNENFYTRRVLFLETPFLMINQCPKELDYPDIYKPANLVSVDTFCRQETVKVELPAEFQDGRKLIYLSMGSMGGFDVDLMKRLTGILGRIPDIKAIVSKGPRGDEYELPTNCWGENYLPQPTIVEMADLVITHGGNNSTCETFAAGKPMIVMPLFIDQFDNAQRVHETGYGRRIEPYDFRDEDLMTAIKEMLADEKLKEKTRAAKLRIQTEETKGKAAKLLAEMILNR